MKPLDTPEALAPELAKVLEIVLTRGTTPPPSAREGAAVHVGVRNQKATPVRLIKLDPDGKRQQLGEMSTASQRLLRTQVGETWLVEDTQGNLLGHFIVPPKGARVKID